jgi:hypothetical protein
MPRPWQRRVFYRSSAAANRRAPRLPLPSPGRAAAPPAEAAAPGSDAPPAVHLATGAPSNKASRHALADLVCLRHLDRRRCAAADAARGLRRGAEVVVLEIPGSSNNKPRGGRENDGTGAGTNDSGGGGSGPAQQAALASALLAGLGAAGVRAVHDACARGATPGARFFAWEAAGVPLRAEIGAREAAAGCVTLALHPALAASGPLLARLWRSRALRAALPGAGAAPPPRGAALRLAAIPLAGAPAACHAILVAAAAAGAGSADAAYRGVACCPAVPDAPPAGAAFIREEEDSEGGAEGERSGGSPRADLLPDGVCPKLHLWSSAGGGSDARCPVHLRHLLRLGPPCHCRIRCHVSMEQLKAEVADRLRAQRGQAVERWEAAAEPSPPGQAVLFISGLPRECAAAALRQQLAAALEPYGLVRGAGLGGWGVGGLGGWESFLEGARG